MKRNETIEKKGKSRVEILRKNKKKITYAILAALLVCGGEKLYKEGIIKFGEKKDLKEDVSKVPVGIGQTERLVIEDDNFDDGDGINPDLFADDNLNNSLDSSAALQQDEEENDSNNAEKESVIKTAGNKDDGPTIPGKKATPEKTTPIQKLKNSIPGLVGSGDVLSVSALEEYLQKNGYLDESGSLNPGSGLSQEQLDELIKYFENDISDYQKVSGWVGKYVDLNKISVDSDDKTGEKTFTVSLNERSTFKFRTGPDSRRFSFTEGGNAIRTLDGIKNNYANEIGADLTIFGILREILLKKLNLTI